MPTTNIISFAFLGTGRDVAVAGAVKKAVGGRSDEGDDLGDNPADEIDPNTLKQVQHWWYR